MYNGIVIKTDGTVETYTDAMDLKPIYSALDIEIFQQVDLELQISAYVDEESLLNGAAVNDVATSVFNTLGFSQRYLGDGYVRGNVLVFGGIDLEEGIEKQLTQNQFDMIMDLAAAK